MAEINATRSSGKGTLRGMVAGLALKPLKDPFWANLAKHQMPLVTKEYQESSERDMQRWARVVKDMIKMPRGDTGEIDWDTELAHFDKLAWPEYYLQPFHSVPGGWLSREAALNNRPAMQSIYVDCHPDSCLGMYRELARYIPCNAEIVVDLGAGCCDGSAAYARQLPSATVIAIDASPFMLIVGRRLNGSTSNLEFKHALAEATGLNSSSVDCVVITLVLHECSDEGKIAIVQEAFRILRPGGSLILNDTPPKDLITYRGFLEPHKIAWTNFDATTFLSKIGFVDIVDACVTDPPPKGFQVRPTEQCLFTRIGKKPFSRF